MSAKLKVDELRAQLSLRGLDTAGTKPTLVERLDAALRKEQDAAPSASRNAGRKRRREADPDLDPAPAPAPVDQEPADGVTDVAAEDLQAMGVRQLRELAASRGLLTSGTKRELLERLSVDPGKGEEIVEAVQDGFDGEGVKKEKLVKATKKGRAVLDQWLSDQMKNSYHVLQIGEETYDATLNQTNVGDNNNKFYVIQALESDDGGTFMVYNRWGRVGVKGQDKLHGPYTSRERAINEFQMKFLDKTKNHWSDRKNFTYYPKCYAWLEMDYGEDIGAPILNKTDESMNSQIRETKLEPHISKFVSLICNISMMKQQMLEIGYNAEKLPLGKLSKSTILKGYDVLRRISEVMGKSDSKKLAELSGEFYTVIPHDFGFKKMHSFVIDTPSKLKSKLEMVETLGEIEIATKLLNDDMMQDDPLYSRYQQLSCGLTPVEGDSKDFLMIKRYMLNTHAETHSNYTVNIEQILKVSRQGESERFGKFSDLKNRMLLWHGSRLTNWTGILSQGLRIAPPEAPATGYMFGKGVYFADMFSKSANYCFASQQSRTGVLLLCEVALGDMAELLTADYNANYLPEGKYSTKGVGRTAPNPSEFETLDDGLVVPLGKPKKKNDLKASLMYNEYIVYNVEQIRMRYIVQVNFNFKR